MAGRGRNRVPENPALSRRARSWSGSTRFRGPGVCGAEFPLKGRSTRRKQRKFRFADESLRPPAQYRQPAALTGRSRNRRRSQRRRLIRPTSPYTNSARCASRPMVPPPSEPISLAHQPGVAPEEDDIELPPEGAPGAKLAANNPTDNIRDLIWRRPPTRHAIARQRLIRRVPMSAQAIRRRCRDIRTAARQFRRRLWPRRRKTGGDPWPVRSSRCLTAGSPIPCSLQPCAGSARAWSRSSRSPPIPAGA